MQSDVFAAVLFAALLHAGWNSVVKTGLDRVSTVLLLAIVQGAIAVPLLAFVDQPDPAAGAWILAGAALHVGYKLFLIRAYEHADLSQAYPLARGAAPLVVAVVSAAFLGETFGPTALAAILAISAGILLMALKGSAAGRMSGPAIFYALGTAGFTAAYTLVDGLGARIAGSASGFILWLFVCDGLMMAAFALVSRGAGAFRRLLPAWKSGTAAGAMSLGSYWIAVWAFTQAPIALVAALRESSILFAALIGAFLIREPVSGWRWSSVACIACGVALMKA